jgi:RluA family pseudouridine synthase
LTTILFEDGDLLAVEKAEGLASIPESDRDKESLLAQLENQRGARLYVVHRLDKEVSGVILFAKTPDMHRYLNAQFSERQVHKTYLALVHGVIDHDEGVVDLPLREFGSGRMGVDRRRGKPSVTIYQVIQRCGPYTLLSLHPVTGRRHQLRVHLFSMGHPIVGDSRYGDRAVQAGYPRLMLHAQAISLSLPSGGRVDVECPPPAFFTRFVNSVCDSFRGRQE